MAHLSSSPHNELRDIEEPLDDYRAVSGLAITGLLLGVCSVLALIHPVLWLLPLAGIVCDWLALRQMALASPPLLGRKAALIGMALSLIFGLSGPVQYWVHRRALRAEAIELADEWFTALRENQPEYAFRLTRQPTTKAARARPPVADRGSQEEYLKALRNAVHEEPTELLLKLGKKAHVRLFQHDTVWRDEINEGVRDLYAVTVGKGSEAVSFFIRIGCSRSQNRGTGEWEWQLTKHEFISFPDPQVLEALE